MTEGKSPDMHHALLSLEKMRVSKKGGETRPHKYLLLLSVIALHDKYGFHANRYSFTEIEPIFQNYYDAYSPQIPHGKMLEYPFYHMKNDGFWFLKVKSGLEEQFKTYEKTRMTRRRLLETVEYGYMNSEMYESLCHDRRRKILRETIIEVLQTGGIGDVKYLIAATALDGFLAKESPGIFEYGWYAISTITNAIERRQIGGLINDVTIYDHQSNNCYKYNIIIVAHSGIYVVELKHWSGYISIKPYNWIINNTHFRTDPHKANTLKCEILERIYRHNFTAYPDVSVESIVVLTNPQCDIDGAHSPGLAAERPVGNLTFASIPDLISYLRKRDAGPGGQLLDGRQVDAVIDYLHGLNSAKKPVKYVVPGYETVEYLSQEPECIELLARPLDGRAKGLNRFRIFRPSPRMAADEKRCRVEKAFDSLKMVSQIRHHPHIQKVWVTKNDFGDIIEGSNWCEAGTLKDMISRQAGPFAPDDALGVCRGILHGLNGAHQLGVAHGAIKPENVLMCNGIPKLINFDLNQYLEEDCLMVTPDASQVKDDGYLAPEVLLGGDIGTDTDLFSVGVIAYEMLTGSKPFVSVRGFLSQGGVLGDKQLEKLFGLALPDKCIETIMDVLVANRVERFADIGKAIAAFNLGANGDKQSDELDDVNSCLQPGEDNGVYIILEQINKGREAQIYKARNPQGVPVALKMFNKEIAPERIIHEAEVASAINSSYVVHSDNKIGHWEKDRYFLVLDYIPGETMRQKIESMVRPDVETFRTVAYCLMQAVKAFHQHMSEEGRPRALLHSDIKPDNVIITPGPGSKAVLIDCGTAGRPRVDVFGGTNGYVPPDGFRGMDMQFSESGDLFALGVTLWEWLFGQRPYENPSVGDTPLVPADIGADFKAVMPWLLKAIATKAEERFAGIDEMLDAFAIHNMPAGAGETLKGGVAETKAEIADSNRGLVRGGNPFVDYINSLSEASAGNENAIAESQLASGFFDRILVRNPLADFILETLVCDKINVILTGNAGDGKTTIAADIYRRITGTFPGTFAPKEKAGDVVIVKDMSELARCGERAAILEGALKDENNRYLIVSNTGTLLETFRTLKIGEKGADESNLLKALGADEPTFVLDDHFMVLNIANMDSIDTAGQVFERMLDGENWTTCLECQLFSDCPIFNNVRLLQENLQMVSERIILLYRRLYEYDVRLTMRQMTGHLAYAVTAGRSCADVRVMSLTALQECLDGSLFFNRVFGDDGDTIMPEAGQLLPVRKIREAEFGVLLDPLFERKAWVRGNVELPLKGQALKIGKELAKKNDPTARRQVRRLVYFFGQAGERYIATFLRSPMLTRFLEYVRGGANISGPAEEKYRRQILHVLQEYFVGVRLPEETRQWPSLYITLTPLGSGTNTQMVSATLRETDFNVFVKHRYKVGDNNSFVLCLRFRDSVRMVLNLPFLDFIARRYRGELAEELSAHYATRLEQFKVDLLDMDKRLNEGRERNLTLIRIKYGGGFDVIKMHVSGAALEVFS